MADRDRQVPVEVVTDAQWEDLDRLFRTMRELKRRVWQRRAQQESQKEEP